MTIGDLFHSDPTRDLEEVQKVNARERARTDVHEFYETESARRVLTELGEVVETHPGEGARFLYLHATFGSGKTHLLKLVGLVADDDSEYAHLGDELAEKWPGFDNLRRSVEESHVDRLEPVFLNLLNRDASKEPPLPFLIFEAIGRDLGYPTDRNWLLEWAWTLDMEYDGIWDALQAVEHDGQTFEEALDGRAELRRWLYDALPAMPETTGTDLETRAGVKASIDTAVDDVDPESFDAAELVRRVETATEALNAGGTRTELLLGLDEVALFVGDSKHRYREFEETMEALQYGPNPVVVTTGQYSLPATRAKLVGDPPADHWTHQQVPLEGADTEIIVRKRWLQKDPAGTERVESLVAAVPDLSLATYSSVTSADPDPVESYPFREYDLTLLRAVMQELITQGRTTDRDYIQGRALLVLVRSLFTKFGWAEAEAGALVTWDELFDLLVEELTYVPLWVQELLENSLIPTFGGDEDAWEVRVAKALYLLNQTPAVPATPENLGRLLFGDVEASLDAVVDETASALEKLEDNRLVLTETNDRGDEVYTLVSEEQESILNRAQTKAEQVSPHQLSAWLKTRFTENDDFFRSDGSRHEVDVGDERLVPLRFEYSVLDAVDRAPSPQYDALGVRVLAEDPERIDEQVETWQAVNDGAEGGEHVLVTLEVPEILLDQVRNVIGMGQVLEAETESHEELEREHRTDKRRLEAAVSDVLSDASVYTVHEHAGLRSTELEATVAQQLTSVFGSRRKVLSRPLVEVEDARAMAAFFHQRGEWPLSTEDAAMLGVDTDAATLTDDGWCRAFVDRYRAQTAVDVETVLQQTRTANGAYRGTPRESVSALLITLATSNERVALKQETAYLRDPTEIGQQVRTKGGLTSLQVHFDVSILPPKQVKRLVALVVDGEPAGDGPDEWLDELESWLDGHSVSVKRILKRVDKEFGVPLETFAETVDPALAGNALTTSDLGDEARLDELLSEAETFDTARDLFVADDEGPPLWERFTDELATMEAVYPSAPVTSSMRKTANGDTVPSRSTVEKRLADAEGHRLDTLSAQYRRITGESVAESGPATVCAALAGWLRANEGTVRDLLADAEATFDVDPTALAALFEAAWRGEDLDEADVADAAVVRQAETFERVRALFDDSGGQSLWTRLEAAAEDLREAYPDSLTRKSVDDALAAGQPPTARRVEQLLAEAEDPIVGEGSTWERLTRLHGELQLQLPSADVTREVAAAVEADDPPTEERVSALLEEAETVLERMETVTAALDDLDEGSIVVIERDE